MFMVFDEPILIALVTEDPPKRKAYRKPSHGGLGPLPRSRGYRSFGHSALALATTCRQIYSEAVQQYYGLNTFLVNFASNCQSFIQAVGPVNVNLIRHVKFMLGEHVGDFRHFKNLQTLEIVPDKRLDIHYGWYRAIEIGWRDDLGEDLREFCKTAQYLRRITIAAHPGPDSFMNWYITGSPSGDKDLEMKLNKILSTRVRK